MLARAARHPAYDFDRAGAAICGAIAGLAHRRYPSATLAVEASPFELTIVNDYPTSLSSLGP
jgi:hypothetical protein